MSSDFNARIGLNETTTFQEKIWQVSIDAEIPFFSNQRSKDQIINKAGVNLLALVEKKDLVIFTGHAEVDPIDFKCVILKVCNVGLC